MDDRKAGLSCKLEKHRAQLAKNGHSSATEISENTSTCKLQGKFSFHMRRFVLHDGVAGTVRGKPIILPFSDWLMPPGKPDQIARVAPNSALLRY